MGINIRIPPEHDEQDKDKWFRGCVVDVRGSSGHHKSEASGGTQHGHVLEILEEEMQNPILLTFQSSPATAMVLDTGSRREASQLDKYLIAFRGVSLLCKKSILFACCQTLSECVFLSQIKSWWAQCHLNTT